MATTDSYDLLVVGAGVFGLSVAAEAGRRGRHTLVLEQATIPHRFAASYGPSRLIRAAYADPHYARLAMQALVAWRQVEAETGRALLVPTGSLFYSNLDRQPELEIRARAASQAGARMQLLAERDLRSKFPQLQRARQGLWESDAGFLSATECVDALYALARRFGVTFLAGRRVEAVAPGGRGLILRAGEQSFTAPTVVVATGGWSNRLFPDLQGLLSQAQQGIMYLHGVPEAFTSRAWVPFVCLDSDYYGFPAQPQVGVGMKIAHHGPGLPTTDPDFDRAVVPPDFTAGVERYLSEDLGLRLGDYQVTYDSCMYNLSRSSDFLLDFHPTQPGLFFATAGSGHGFKFGSIIGRIVVDRLDGLHTDLWSPHFSYAHFRTATPVPRLI